MTLFFDFFIPYFVAFSGIVISAIVIFFEIYDGIKYGEGGEQNEVPEENK